MKLAKQYLSMTEKNELIEFASLFASQATKAFSDAIDHSSVKMGNKGNAVHFGFDSAEEAKKALKEVVKMATAFAKKRKIDLIRDLKDLKGNKGKTLMFVRGDVMLLKPSKAASFQVSFWDGE